MPIDDSDQAGHSASLIIGLFIWALEESLGPYLAINSVQMAKLIRVFTGHKFNFDFVMPRLKFAFLGK